MKTNIADAAVKHTPGPWNVMEGKTLLHIETDATAPEAGLPICSIAKRDRANARLIASAPRLLVDRSALVEALKGMLRIFEANCPGNAFADFEASNAEVIAARAALRAAGVI